MRKLKLLLLIIITLFWFIVIAPYFLLQTNWGAHYFSQLVSQLTTYEVTIGGISHSFAKPYEIVLQQVMIKNNDINAPISLNSEKVIIGLNQETPWQYQNLRYVILRQGEIHLSPSGSFINLTSERLQLWDISLFIAATDDLQPTIKIAHASGGMQPWYGQLWAPEHNYQFNLTAQAVNYADLNIDSVVLQGEVNEQITYINNFGGNVNQGFFIAKAQLEANHTLIIEQLKVNQVRLQSNQRSDTLLTQAAQWPPISIKQLAVINSDLQLADLMVAKGNLELDHVDFHQHLILGQGQFRFNAQTVVYQNEAINQPQVDISSQDNHITINNLSGEWQQSQIKLNGDWQDNQLALRQLSIDGLDYRLPEEWLQKLHAITTPDKLAQITVDKLILQPSIIVDTQPDFPMQFTGLELNGLNLTLVKDNKFNFSAGTLNLKATHATVNTVTLRHAELTLRPEADNLAAQFSALTSTGTLEAKLQANITTNQIAQLTINGYGTDPQILPQWHITDNAPLQRFFTFTLTGQLIPLKLQGQYQTKLLDQLLSYPIRNSHIDFTGHD